MRPAGRSALPGELEDVFSMEEGCAATVAGGKMSQVRLRSMRHVVVREDGLNIAQINL